VADVLLHVPLNVAGVVGRDRQVAGACESRREAGKRRGVFRAGAGDVAGAFMFPCGGSRGRDSTDAGGRDARAPLQPRVVKGERASGLLEFLDRRLM
jgi:hypothetical protein